MYDTKLLNEVLQTYRAQGSAISKQLEFADFMIDDFIARLDKLSGLSLESVVDYCRTFVKYYDLRERLILDGHYLANEQSIIENSITNNG